MKIDYTEDYHVKDDAIFKDYVQKKKSLSEHSVRAYRNSLNKLCKATEETLYNIVDICKKEQRPRIEEDKSITLFSPNDFDSSINIYFGQFVEYCEAEGNKNTTINDNMRAIRTFFNFYEVKLPNWKPLEDDSEDWHMLTKEDIRFVLNDSTIVHSAIITFLLSTGMREEDACSLTIGDFMEATSSYHDYVDVEEFIDNAPNDMKGYWSFEPQKTQRYKVECKTFNSPESSNYILQSLRKIKNEYIPYKNKKDGLNLKISKKSALFGSRNAFYLDSLTPQSVTDAFTRKNVKLREWNISQIDLKIKNKEISEEDREENIKKIPKFHPHGLRKYFCNTVKKYGDVRTCLVLEGHKSKISTDKSYIKISKDDVEKVYNKAMADLSIAPIEAKILTDSEAEELREEVKSLNRKLAEKDKETQKYKDEIARLKASSTTLTNQIVNIQEQIDNINHLNDITRIQDYIADNDLVKKYGLASRVIELYKEDIKKGVASADNSYIDTLITRAYNHSLFDGENQFVKTLDEGIEEDDLYIELEHRIFSTYESLLNGTNIQVSDAQGQKITKKLHEYLIQIWKAKGEVDDGYVSKLINDILLNG